MSQERFLECIQNQTAPHAILIAGPAGAGKRTLARRAASIYCLGEDALERLSGCPNYAELGQGAVSVDSARRMLGLAALQGFNGGKRAFVLINAHRMSVQIQNTLLKTLEEPHEDTLLLLTGSEYGLLPTVRSRCMIERLGAGDPKQTERVLLAEGVPAARAALASALSNGLTGLARELASDEETAFREQALELLERSLFQASPFQEAAALVSVKTAFDETDDDAGVKRGKKKSMVDPTRALRLLEVWQSVLRDALVSREGGAAICNLDRADWVRDLAARFTTGRIQGIIEALAKAQTDIIGGANVQMTLDAALARLYARESR